MTSIRGYKAFNKDMTCRGFQFEEGQTYETDKAVICESGFHFCENPLDVLNYYNLCESEFAEVESLGETQAQDEDSKVCTTKIKIGARLSLSDFIKASVKFLLEKDASQLAASGYYSKLAASGSYSRLAASGDSSQLAASGDYSQLAASGYSSKLAASGDHSKLAASGSYSKLAASGSYSRLAASGSYSRLAASGYSSKLAASGDYSKLAASGDHSQLEITGSNTVGAAIGINNRIKASLGCWITLAEYKWDGKKHIPVCVKSVQVDGEIIKANTWYKLQNDVFVEA